MWALCALFGVLLATSSVVAPLFLAPDEFVHADLALRLADDAHYPEHDGRQTAAAVKRVAIPYFGETPRRPDKDAADAPPKAGRLDIDSLGGSGDDPTGSFNQQPQHPPLYYQLLGAVLRVERVLVPGAGPPALVTEVAVLRLVNAAMVVLLPLAAWATAHRLGARRATAVTAAALVLTVPQLSHIGSTINNDNLLTALASALAVLLAGVVRGDRRARTAALVAVVAGLALLTKAFAFLLLPWIAVAYLVAARRRARPLDVRTVATGVAAGIGALVVGGWWWVGNRLRTGSFAPSLEQELIPSTPGFAPDAGFFVRRFGAFFTERFWGWFGLFSARMPLVAIGAATAVLVALVVVGLAVPAPRLRRPDLVVVLVPVAGVGAFVVQHAWSIYARSGQTPFIQGRYLFAVIVPLLVVAAAGLGRLAGRWAPGVALAAAITLQVVGFATMLDQFWGRRARAWPASSGPWWRGVPGPVRPWRWGAWSPPWWRRGRRWCWPTTWSGRHRRPTEPVRGSTGTTGSLVGHGRARGQSCARRPCGPRRRTDEIDVSIVLPVYNEKGHLRQEIDRIRAAMDASEFSYEIIVIDDGSDDGSGEALRAGRGHPAHPVPHQPGLGLGPQVRHPGGAGPDRGVDRRRHDLPQRPHPRAGAGDGGLRPGGRRPHHRGGHPQGRSGCRPSRSSASWRRYLVQTPIPDLNSGMRAFRRDVALQYVSQLPPGFSCVTTITLTFLAHGYTVKYWPIDYSERAGESKFHWASRHPALPAPGHPDDPVVRPVPGVPAHRVPVHASRAWPSSPTT